jgi:hypothetical protein
MTKNEQKMYSDVTSIRESLEKIANVLSTNVPTTPKPKDIPGFEGTLDALDVLCDIKTITDEYATLNQSNEALIARHKNKLSSEFQKQDEIDVHSDYIFDLVKGMSKEQYVKFYLDMDFGFALSDKLAFTDHILLLDYDLQLDVIKSALQATGELDIAERIGSDIGIRVEDDFYTYEHELDKNGDNSVVEYKEGIINDSDHEIRKNACFYESILNTKGDNDYPGDLRTKKDCILDYITGEFGVLGARYTDIIKFAYYLGEHYAPKYDNSNRGYYACAFNTRFGGHLIKGGKDQLVKGINKEGNERYFAHSFVDQATDYYKRIR